jgi:arylsulfatase A-like enzyme
LNHMHPTCAVIAAVLATHMAWAAPSRPAAPPPNIVYVLADDQGWKDVGFHGSDIRTPNLDQLAREGVRLEQFYAQPMCTPSRAALMTGRYPHRYGLQTLVIPSAGTYGLATDEWLLPQALKSVGYRTAIVGKWQLGHADRKYWPMQRGFDQQYGPLLVEIDYFTHSAHGTRDWFRNEQRIMDQGYVTQLLGDEAVRLIESHDTGTPLFLYLAFTTPHAPYQAPKDYLDRYADIADPARRAYAAMISAMDDQIGRVVRALQRRGMRGDTLIIFQSDNGGPRSAAVTGEIDMSGSTIPADNGAYRDGKASLYEGGTRVVALANWPGHIPPGVVVDEPIHIVDMYPTLTALAGVPLGAGKPLDGLNVWPTLSARQPSPRSEVVYGVEPFRAAVRQGPWKLVWQATLPSRLELFDLSRDVTETTNVAAEHPEQVAALKRRAEALAQEAVPPLLMGEAIGVVRSVLFGSVVIPAEAEALDLQP